MNIKILRQLPKRLISKNTIYLVIDKWNDYSFETLFHLYIADLNTPKHIGGVKIGFKGQTTDISTYEKLKDINLEKLPEDFFL